MGLFEQTDGFEPDKQTPPSTSTLGTSTNKFDEVHATSGNFTSLVVGATGRAVPGYYSTVVDLVALTAKSITHSLGNSNPIIMVYGSGTNQVLPMGSGTGTVIYAASGTSANAIEISATAGVLGSVVVVIG